ncbi:hypothetical protein Emed_004378 [Eimeria media]
MSPSRDEKRLASLIPERNKDEAIKLRRQENTLTGKVEDTRMQQEGLKGQLAELSSQPQRQAEQRELAEHMLHAVEQQGVRTAQQTEEQDALFAQSAAQIQEALFFKAGTNVHLRSATAVAAAAAVAQIEQQHQKLKEQRRLEFVEGNEAHSAAHAALKSVAGELHRAREELLHSKTALEKSKVDYKRGSAQRDLAATLLPPFVARKGELELQKKAYLKEAAMRAKEAEVLKEENEALYGSIKGDNKRREDLEADAAQLLLRLSRWSALEAEVAGQRQSAALAVAESERLRRETQEQLKLKMLEADSAQKRLRELAEAQQREQVGIERVRQQCESYANQMQVATQGLAELLDRQKVLANELDVFSQDIKAKEATTQQQQQRERGQQQQQQKDEEFEDCCHSSPVS